MLKAPKYFVRGLRKRIEKYLEEPEHRKEFEEWYFHTYGVKYEWKKRRERCDGELTREARD